VDWLKIFVIVAIVGIVCTAWIVLRGYGRHDNDRS